MPDRIEQLRKFHEAEPDDTFATYGIAMEHLKRGEPDEALTWLNKTLEIDPDYAYCYYQKARTLQQLDRLDEAWTTVQQGIDAAKRTGDEKAISELNDLSGMLK